MRDKSIMNTRVLSQYFKNLEQVIDSHYSLVTSDHNSDKGEDREEFLVTILNNNLPKLSLAYRGGEILDCWDNKSSQTDIVIYSSFSPFLRDNKKPLFLAEGTFAAIEVKSELNYSSLLSALRWSTRIKKLEKFMLPKESGIMAFNSTAKSICTGVFAYKSKITDIEKLLEKIDEYHRSGVPNFQMIDFICVNNKFCLCRNRTEDIASYYSTDGKITLEDRKKQSIYMSYPDALGIMLSTILDYISYIGPAIHTLKTYLYPCSRGDGKQVGLE